MMNAHSIVLALLLSVLFLSCSKKEQKETDLVTFPLKGEVVDVDTTTMRITISHEEIPNYMMAMTMPFRVKNKALIKNVQIGDSVQGTLAVSRVESWLETLTVIGKSDAPDTKMAEGSILARVFKIGDTLPNDPLTNQDNQQIHFSDFKGKAIALTFVYTRCPLPDFCIRMSEHFAKLQKTLNADKSLNGKWHLITISFDPAFDTPKVLKEYGKTYTADFTTWDFVTAPEQTIMKLADGLGLTLATDEGLITHNLRTVLLDKNGQLAKVMNGNEWKPEEVVDLMKKSIRE
jgi:protein SCO1/2